MDDSRGILGGGGKGGELEPMHSDLRFEFVSCSPLRRGRRSPGYDPGLYEDAPLLEGVGMFVQGFGNCDPAEETVGDEPWEGVL